MGRLPNLRQSITERQRVTSTGNNLDELAIVVEEFAELDRALSPAADNRSTLECDAAHGISLASRLLPLQAIEFLTAQGSHETAGQEIRPRGIPARSGSCLRGHPGRPVPGSRPQNLVEHD